MEPTGKTKNLSDDRLIIVYYLDVRNIENDDIPNFMTKVMNQIKLESPIIGEIIALPVNSETRVECINPKYITEPELIREHRLKMDGLHEITDKFITEYNDEGKEKMD